MKISALLFCLCCDERHRWGASFAGEGTPTADSHILASDGEAVGCGFPPLGESTDASVSRGRWSIGGAIS